MMMTSHPWWIPHTPLTNTWWLYHTPIDYYTPDEDLTHLMKTSRIWWRPHASDADLIHLMLASHTWWRPQIQYLMLSSHTSWLQTPGGDLIHLIMTTSHTSWLTIKITQRMIYLTVTHMITTSSNWWRPSTNDDNLTQAMITSHI